MHSILSGVPAKEEVNSRLPVETVALGGLSMRTFYKGHTTFKCLVY